MSRKKTGRARKAASAIPAKSVDVIPAKSADIVPAHEPISVNDVVGMFGVMSRILTRLGEHSLFKDQQFGFSEWLFMHAVRQFPGEGPAQIARRLQITPQRSAQMVNSMTALEYITAEIRQDDTRKKQLAISDLGREKIAVIDEQILQLMSKVFSERAQMFNIMKRLRALNLALAPVQA